MNEVINNNVVVITPNTKYLVRALSFLLGFKSFKWPEDRIVKDEMLNWKEAWMSPANRITPTISIKLIVVYFYLPYLYL